MNRLTEQIVQFFENCSKPENGVIDVQDTKVFR